jgi:hypothetical protein
LVDLVELAVLGLLGTDGGRTDLQRLADLIDEHELLADGIRSERLQGQ